MSSAHEGLQHINRPYPLGGQYRCCPLAVALDVKMRHSERQCRACGVRMAQPGQGWLGWCLSWLGRVESKQHCCGCMWNPLSRCGLPPRHLSVFRKSMIPWQAAFYGLWTVFWRVFRRLGGDGGIGAVRRGHANVCLCLHPCLASWIPHTPRCTYLSIHVCECRDFLCPLTAPKVC